jgi:hypothetical protein
LLTDTFAAAPPHAVSPVDCAEAPALSGLAQAADTGHRCPIVLIKSGIFVSNPEMH